MNSILTTVVMQRINGVTNDCHYAEQVMCTGDVF